MSRGTSIIVALIALGLGSTAASAAVSVPVPEPGDVGLFALAVAGLLIGRRSSRTKVRRDEDIDA